MAYNKTIWHNNTKPAINEVNLNKIENQLALDSARIDEIVTLPPGSTQGNEELVDIRVGADGTTYTNAGTAVRAQVGAIKEDVAKVDDRLNGEYEVVSKSGSEFQFSDNTKVNWESQEDARVYAYKKNMFVSPSVLGMKSNSAGVTDIVFGDDYISAKANGTYKNVRTKPIFLKAGVYKLSARIEILAGSGTGNIGFVYVQKCDKDGNITQSNYSAIQINATNKYNVANKEVTEDTYVMFDFYVNLNGSISSSDITVKFYDLTINREDGAFTGYEPYVGTVQDGNSGIVEVSKDIKMYSDKTIGITYKHYTGQTYEDVSAQVAQNTSDIEDLKHGISKSNKIVCWGDSLTAGTGSTSGKPSTDKNADVSYPAVLGRMMQGNFEVLNGGIGGETSWMISARQGGESIYVEPTTIPATKTATRVYLKGQEQDYFWDNTQNKWVYFPNNLSYNIAVSDASRVNPCYIDGIEGTLTRTQISVGNPDPTTGETVQSATFAYYFTRNEEGEAKTFNTPKQLITNAYKNLRDAVNVIWMGQNDAPEHDGRYITQGNATDRAQLMLDVLSHNKYIVMNLPSGNNASQANNAQVYNNKFGSHYINIREYISKYGVAYANSLGAGIAVSAEDQALIDAGQIPSCLRSDSVHGNYWYYQIVAKAVYDKGVELGYWN